MLRTKRKSLKNIEYEKAVEWKIEDYDYNPTDAMCAVKSVAAPKGVSPLAQ